MTEPCSICGSSRVVEGPAYARDEYTCMDCGSQFNREVRRMPTEEEVKEQLPTIPEGGFDSPEAAQAHLRKMQQAAAKIAGTPIISKKKTRTPPPAAVAGTMPLIDDFPPELVFLAIHCYKRPGESDQAVVNTAKGERSLRAENVRVFVHRHSFGEECKGCREIQ